MNVDALEIVQNSRRRALLKVLKELGGKACLREIVKRIAEREEGPDFGSRLEKSIHVSLLQTHLPKMENAGLIEYDEKKGIVRLLEFPSEVRYHLEFVERGDVPWSIYYLVLSLAGLVLSLVLANVLAVTLSAFFLIASIVHVFNTYKFVNGSLTSVKRALTKRVLRRKYGLEKKTMGGESL